MEVLDFVGGFAKVRAEGDELSAVQRLVDIVDNTRTRDKLVYSGVEDPDGVKEEFEGLMGSLFPGVPLTQTQHKTYGVTGVNGASYSLAKRGFRLGSAFDLGRGYQHEGNLVVVEPKKGDEGVYLVTMTMDSAWKRRPVDDLAKKLAFHEGLGDVDVIEKHIRHTVWGHPGVLAFDRVLEIYAHARATLDRAENILPIVRIRGEDDLNVLFRDKSEHENAFTRQGSKVFYGNAIRALYEAARKRA